jgi:hypothetical protein
MAITIDATVGGASSNSYVTLAEADTFLEIESDTWTAEADDEVKKRWLVKAQRVLSREFKTQWRGSRVNSTQALDWPRSGVESVDAAGGYLGGYGGGYYGVSYYGVDEIPQQVKDAQCLLAAALLDGSYAEGEAVRATSYATDDLSESGLEYAAAIGALPTQVTKLLAGLLTGGRLARG